MAVIRLSSVSFVLFFLLGVGLCCGGGLHPLEETFVNLSNNKEETHIRTLSP